MFRKLFYASASVLMIAFAYHLGASTATAQAPGNPVVATFGNLPAAITANGDIYLAGGINTAGPWTHVGNIFGGATPAATQSWGALKARYR